MEQIVKKIKWLYASVLLVTCIPLTLGYLMNTGEIHEWAQRLTETFLYKMVGSVVLWYLAAVVLIQIITFAGMCLLMTAVYDDSVACLLGVTLYMSCPYRLSVIYQQVDFNQAILFALLPWLVLIFKKIRLRWLQFFSVPVSAVIGVLIYLMLSANDGLTIQNITAKGYAVSDFLTMWKFSDKPGLGLGLILGGIGLLWALIVEEGKLSKERKLLLGIFVLFCLMATKYFPWEMAQRISGLSLQLVSLLGSPAVFFGIACFVLCLLIPWIAEALRKEHAGELVVGSLITIWLGAMAGAVYFCNTLTFYTPGI